jgi:hypothetical protein
LNLRQPIFQRDSLRKNLNYKPAECYLPLEIKDPLPINHSEALVKVQLQIVLELQSLSHHLTLKVHPSISQAKSLEDQDKSQNQVLSKKKAQ